MKQFSIPAGMRDLILGECEIKKQVQLEIESCLDKWGYREIITPTIEFYQTYNVGFDNMQEEDMYKFFDSTGKILMLRADMTIPIARVVATKFKDAQTPLRFRYCANVFKVHEELNGLKNEISDCGVELIGVEEKGGDLEILVTAMEALKVVKNKKCILEIGNVRFFREACKYMGLNAVNTSEIAKLIDEKSLKSLDDYIMKLNLKPEYQNFFKELPWLSGDVSVLKEIKKYAFNDTLNTIILNLEELNSQLNELGYSDIQFDLGKVTNLNYYTGIIFEAFVEGIGARVMSGGRYDTLTSKYGRDLAAVGFSIKLDALIQVIEPLKKASKYILEYPLKDSIEALKKSKILREEKNVELRINNTIDEIKISEVE